MIIERVRGYSVLGLVLLAFVSGCSGTSGDDDDDDDDDDSESTEDRCFAICEEVEEANCVDSNRPACESSCFDFVDLERDTSECTSSLDRYLSCVEEVSDTCSLVDDDASTASPCQAQAERFVSCMLSYCTDHTSASYCS